MNDLPIKWASTLVVLNSAILGVFVQTPPRAGDRVYVINDEVKVMRGREVITTGYRGQVFDVVDVRGKWVGVRIETAFDEPSQTAWIDGKHVKKVELASPGDIKVINPHEEHIWIWVWCYEDQDWMKWDSGSQRNTKFSVGRTDSRYKKLRHLGTFRLVLETEGHVFHEIGDCATTDDRITVVIEKKMLMQEVIRSGRRQSVRKYVYGAQQLE